VSFNELTLGVERLVRAGNLDGANKLLAEAGQMLGVGSLGRVRKLVSTSAT
jgi:hypothetical protein